MKQRVQRQRQKREPIGEAKKPREVRQYAFISHTVDTLKPILLLGLALQRFSSSEIKLYGDKIIFVLLSRFLSLMSSLEILQVFTIEFVPFAIEFVGFAIEFVGFAVELVGFAIEFVMFALQFVINKTAPRNQPVH